MENKVSNKYFYIISIIVALLVIGITITASFAFFTNSGSTTGTATVITSGSMSLELVDGEVVGLSQGMVPGQKVQKRFKVRNTGSLPTTYNIYLSEIINTFADKSDLVYRLTSTDGGYNTTSDQEVPSEVGEQSKIISNKVIDANQEHNYILEIEFLNKNENQDDNKGKTFSAKLQINEYKNIAVLQTGQEINNKMKKLANPNEDMDDYIEWFNDGNIKSIQRATTLDQNATKELISTDISTSPVYIWFDNGILYYYSELEKIALNQDSSYLFSNLEEVTSIDLRSFDTSLVTNMSNMFKYTYELESLDLNYFNTSNVTNMSEMFYCSSSLSDIDLGSFDTSNVTDMSRMLAGLSGLTNIDLSPLDTSRVTNMKEMFSGLSGLTTIDLSPLDTSKVTNMSYMLSNMSSLTTIDLSPLNTPNVTDMSGLLYGLSGLTTIDLSPLNTSNVTNMSYMFGNMNNLSSIDLSPLDTSNVTNMSGFLYGLSGITSIDLSPLNTSNVTDMSSMLSHTSSLTSLNFGSFDVSNVTNLSYFFDYTNIEELDLSAWDVSKVTRFSDMVNHSNIKKINISNWDFSKDTSWKSALYELFGDKTLMLEEIIARNITLTQTNMDYAFRRYDENLKKIDISGINLVNGITSAYKMFMGNTNLEEIVGLTDLDTSKTTDMRQMFDRMQKIEVLDLSSFDTSKVTQMNSMFNYMTNLRTIYVSNKWSTSSVEYINYSIFEGSTNLVGGAGTTYDSNKVGVSYAHVDGGPTNPGYLTLKTN